jgi:hypothetical protein
MVQFRPVLRRQQVEQAHLPTYVLPVMVPAGLRLLARQQGAEPDDG